MSTQRRDTYWLRNRCAHRAGTLRCSGLAPVTRYRHALANGITARPDRPVELATNSLQKDHHLKDRRVGRIVAEDVASSKQRTIASGTARSKQAGPPAAHGSSLSLLSISSGSALLHLTLPQAPTGDRRWAERYDGKRDLHFQHAA